MKKYLIILMCFVLLTACSLKKETKVINNDNSVNEVEDDIIETPSYIDNNPVKVGFYLDGKRINEYKTKFRNDMDIAVFDIYFTDLDDVGNNSTKTNFNKFYSNYEDASKYKIGFFISYDAIDKHYEKVILNADTEYWVAPYIYVYLYDDIHQADGAWYSHVTKDEYNDETIFSSIKLYLAEKYEGITSPISLTVFTYDGMDDFDEDGYYRGESSHTVIIKNE